MVAVTGERKEEVSEVSGQVDPGGLGYEVGQAVDSGAECHWGAVLAEEGDQEVERRPVQGHF